MDSLCWTYAFLQPTSMRNKIIKLIAALLLLVVGIGMLLFNIPDALAYEQACKDPILVEAVISVDEVLADDVWYRPVPRWEMYLSYEYNGKEYQDVYYYGRQNPYYSDREGEVVTVALNPKNPGELRMQMVNITFSYSVVPISAGLALLIHGILIDLDSYGQWRKSLAEKYPKLLSIDALKDVVVIFVLLMFLSHLILKFIFPNI